MFHLSIYLSVHHFLSFPLFGLLVTSHWMRMSVFSGIYGPFPLPSEGLITPRSKVNCVFLACVFGKGRFMNTLSACANDSTWWSCIWSIISEGRKYSTDTDEGLSHVINLWLCIHMCQVVRWKHFINVLIRLLIRLIASINTGGAATLCTDRLNMDMCAFMH